MQKLGTFLLVGILTGAMLLAGCVAPPEETEGAAIEPAASPSIGTMGVAYRAPAPGLFEAANATLEPVPIEFPLPVGIQRDSALSSFEPTIGVDSDGVVYLSTFAYALPLPGVSLLQRSADGGLTWTDVTPRLGPATAPPQSNDPYVHVDADTNRIFLSDLQALMCATLSFSDDGGASWQSANVGCGLPFGGQDHQTVFTAKPRMLQTVGYQNLVYYCINRVADSACATSVNGGISFGPLVPVYRGVDPMAGGICGGLHAHGAAAPDGTVYIPKGHCGKASVAISEDDGLTWDVVTISDTVPSPGHEVPFAVDAEGNAYALWISEDDLPYLAVSQDGGRTWAEPIMVAPAGLKTTKWPTIAAGDAGRVAIAYYGTSDDLKKDKAQDIAWNAYITVITDALNATPVIATVTANDPADPVSRGLCEGRCDDGGSNGVGDFIDIVIDADGRPWAAFVDVCVEECAKPDGTKNGGASLGFAGTLVTGPRLRGALEALPALPLPVAAEPAS